MVKEVVVTRQKGDTPRDTETKEEYSCGQCGHPGWDEVMLK